MGYYGRSGAEKMRLALVAIALVLIIALGVMVLLIAGIVVLNIFFKAVLVR